MEGGQGTGGKKSGKCQSLHVQSVVECGVVVERGKYQKNYQPFLVSLSFVLFLRRDG